MFTQCPQCQTVFEINAGHLKAANGDVRCGHCLNVFNALEHLSEKLPENVPPIEDVATTESETTTVDTEIFEQSPQPVQTSTEETEDDHELAEYFSDVLPNDGDTDTDYETRVRNILKDNGEERSFYGGADEAIINKILDETITEDSLSYEVEEEEPAPVSSELKKTGSEQIKEEKTKEKTPPKESATEAEENAAIEIPQLLLEDLQNDQEQQSGRSKLWLVGSLILMLGFALQAIYFSRDELAKNPNYRPWLTMACQKLGCKIATPYDISQIEIIGRDVRSHPTAPHALIAGTTLINNAKFNQPYPLLTLTFSNITGTVLAQRRFTPREYLKPGTNIQAGMKPDIPVQVQLELVDPGKDAVNFEFSASADPRSIRPRT